MKLTLLLLQRTSYDLSREILWNEHRQKGYVIRDPNNSDELMYLTSSEYMKLTRVMLSNESLIEVIATPRDNPESIARKFPEDSTKTPKRAVLKEFLFNSNPLWRISDSMIDIRRNTSNFHPTYFKHIVSWLNLKPSRVILKAMYGLGKHYDLIAKANGLSTMVMRLKISTIVVLKYLGGEKVTSTQSLGMRITLRNGLPESLPLPLRTLIRTKSVPYTRAILSVLYSYKGLVADYKPAKLGTIVAPFLRLKMSEVNKLVFDTSSLSYQKHTIPSENVMYSTDMNPGGSSRRPTLIHVFDGGRFMPSPKAANAGRSMNPNPFEGMHARMKFLELEERRARLAKEFFKSIGRGEYFDILPRTDRPPFLLTAGPNCSISFIGSPLDALLHTKMGEKSPLIRWLKFVPKLLAKEGRSTSLSDYAFDNILSHMNIAGRMVTNATFKHNFTFNVDPSCSSKYPPNIKRVMNTNSSTLDYAKLKLGKLSLKFEAAGKVRVFAIVDYWTQWVLKPIHESIFEILKRLPTDATFDQLGKVDEFAKRKYSFIASFDLKAATDLIPQTLYKEVLRHFFGPITTSPLVDMWMDLLIDREYHIELPYKPTFSPSDKTDLVPYDKNQKVPVAVIFFTRYTRGQPMGALSSWGSLALIHHFLVFLSANRANVNNFRDYLVLGDDIVIANESVAKCYQDVCSELGITIGLPKSFVSNTGMFQFASQDVVGTTNFSPISLKEVLSIDQKDHLFFRTKGIVSLAQRVEFVNRLAWKGFIDTNNPLSLVRAFYAPHDWRAISRSLSRGVLPPALGPALLLLLTAPNGIANNCINLNQIMALIKGDLFGLIKPREIGIWAKVEFLQTLYDSLSHEFMKTYDKVQELMGRPFDSHLATTPVAHLYIQYVMEKRQRDLAALEEIKSEFDSLLVASYAILKEKEIKVLLYNLEENTELTLAHFHTYGKLMAKMLSMGNDAQLVSHVVNPSSIQRLRKVKTFVSLNPYWDRRGPMSRLRTS